MAMTYQQYLDSINPAMLDVNGRFLGPNQGVNYTLQGMTPQSAYATATGSKALPFDDVRQGADNSFLLDPRWKAGPSGARGLMGLGQFAIDAVKDNPALMAAAMGAGAAHFGVPGFQGEGPGAGIGHAAGYSPAMDSQAANLGFSNAQAAIDAGAMPPANGFTANVADFGGGGDLVDSTANGAGGTSEPASTTPNSQYSLNGASAPGTGGPGMTSGGAAGPGMTTGSGAPGLSANGLTGASAAAAAGSGGAGGAGGFIDQAGKWISDNPLKVAGLVLGAAGGAAAGQGGQTTQTQNKDPWIQAQPYLVDNLKKNAAMQDYYAANPFSDTQKQQYQGLLNNIANNQAAGNSLLGNAATFMNSRHGLLGPMTTAPTGTQAPNIDWNQYSNIGRK